MEYVCFSYSNNRYLSILFIVTGALIPLFIQTLAHSIILLLNRVLKNKLRAVSQGVRRFGKRSPPAADEHLQKPHNAGSRPEARFFNTLLTLPCTQ
jgi:hypothetical protein